MANSDDANKPIFIGTIRYLLSQRSYRDFIAGGMNVNQLPLLSDSIASLQLSLDRLSPRQMMHSGGSVVYSKTMPESFRQYGPVEPFVFEIGDFYIESVTFESGSVFAKISIVAGLVFGVTQTLAVYPEAKVGFAELRTDIIQFVNDSFGVDGAGPIDGQQQNDDAEISYYFIQPKRLEEEVFKRRMAPGGNPET